jgi:hypothetical protein
VKSNKRQDELRDEYDLRQLKGGIRGKYAAEYKKGTRVRLIQAKKKRIAR